MAVTGIENDDHDCSNINIMQLESQLFAIGHMRIFVTRKMVLGLG